MSPTPPPPESRTPDFLLVRAELTRLIADGFADALADFGLDPPDDLQITDQRKELPQNTGNSLVIRDTTTDRGEQSPARVRAVFNHVVVATCFAPTEQEAQDLGKTWIAAICTLLRANMGNAGYWETLTIASDPPHASWEDSSVSAWAHQVQLPVACHLMVHRAGSRYPDV